MNAPACACCGKPATLVLTEPTDASPEKGTLYCDYCATASSAAFDDVALALTGVIETHTGEYVQVHDA